MAQRFDIYDFRDAWAGVRSVAMVGNAATILQREHGALIDSHDLVVRFNRAHVEGTEDKIGSRTDLLVANAANSLAKAPSPAETLKPRWVMCFVQPQLGADLEPFRAWVGDIPTVVTLSPDILEFATTGRTRGLTLGTYTLYTLLKLFPLDRLFVTGFTMYGAAGGDSHKYYDPGSRAGSYHDLDEEARLFSAILASFRGELQVTSEVGDVLRRHGHAGRLQDAGDAERADADGPSLYYRLLGRLAWRFLRTGFKLRRRFEQGTSIQFDSLKR
jgi:Glycosyltransferase family 29 (sialyltransferase)